ncbi:DUF887 domain protein [Metarhizium album ARSEF 1941]|uniref:DUF887 domain protein n=1 Tax=Metarhizium album (strain ARSEF 1941) TaxID=1081103 RepID=A0A0B2WX12_METAS|nr:DUF887 domain protein [Metarhizium album ARSEF 1941]KHN98598.1 DUF887 domain protein [Metarhizium album ARSEF 1941]
MKDPFFIEPLPWLVRLVQPLCDWLSLPTLSLHIHEIVISALFYSVIFYPISPIASRILAPKYYTTLPRKRRLNWDAHVVSMIQATLINGLAIWVMVTDGERRAMPWEERIWGYTGATSMIQALAAGYFVWDLIVTSMNLDVFGLGTLAHAIAALLVFSLGFRPFVNYYGCIFILWELSTPFLNIHWFMDKLGMTGSKAQLYNGFLLLFSFFSCRLVYGTHQSVMVFRDIWSAINRHPSPASLHSMAMQFATDTSTVPLWLGAVYLASNLTLNSLNFYWFVMMIKAVRKRFEPGQQPQTEVEVDMSSVASAVSSRPAGLHRRKA